eukprot:scaffold10515_cov136-Cylindrotheca_fusiformis.AAC.1
MKNSSNRTLQSHKLLVVKTQRKKTSDFTQAFRCWSRSRWLSKQPSRTSHKYWHPPPYCPRVGHSMISNLNSSPMFHTNSDVPVGQLKRGRDDCQAMEQEEALSHSSKRPKLVDERKVCFSPPLQRQQHYEFPTPPYEYGGTSLEKTMSWTDSPHHHQLQQQTTGQRSCERQPTPPQEAQYQNMNSLLGSLHLARRRQRDTQPEEHQSSAQSASAQQVLSPHVHSSANFRSGRPHSSRKNVVSLRVDSKLY